MSAPERIWAWWEHDIDFRSTHRWEDEARSFSDDEYDGAEYVRADTVAEMIRQAVRAEREACAVITETMHETSWPDTIAAAIRARGDA